MRNRFLFVFIPMLVFNQCNSSLDIKNENEFKATFRLGYKFYLMEISKDGKGAVSKGTCSFYTELFKESSTEMSGTFKVDSVDKFFARIDSLKNSPLVGVKREGVPRLEIYFSQSKIYDSYMWDETYLELFYLVKEKLPIGLNPFITKQRPFH